MACARPSSWSIPFSRLSLRSTPFTLRTCRLRPILQSNTTTVQHDQTRPASHASQGVANRPRRSPGKRLGIKRAATELVVPNTIIYRQRGSKWYPGENCGMGRDHTIYAKAKGYVVFYRDAWKNTGYGGAGVERGDDGKWYRRYIGIVINKGDKLPRPKGKPAPRRLGMYARTRQDTPVREEAGKPGQVVVMTGRTGSDTKSGALQVKGRFSSTDRFTAGGMPRQNELKMTEGYQYREANWIIGRAADRAGNKVKRVSPNAAKRRMGRLWRVTSSNTKARAGLVALVGRKVEEKRQKRKRMVRRRARAKKK